MNICDCCHRHDVETAPYLMDDNAEVTLCRACATKVRAEVMTLERIDQTA